MVYGAIIGDVVNSTSYKELFKLPYQLTSIFEEINKQYKISFQIYRGDSFTIIVHDFRYVENVYSLIKTFLQEKHKLSVKMIYDIGQISHFDDNPGYCYGELLTKLGRKFDKEI